MEYTRNIAYATLHNFEINIIIFRVLKEKNRKKINEHDSHM